MLQKKFYIYTTSFLLGILAHSISLSANINNTFLIFILSFAFLLSLLNSKYLKIISISIVIFLIGFLRFDISQNHNEKHILDYFSQENNEIVLYGEISERPVMSDVSQTLIVDIHGLVLGKKFEGLETKISLKTASVPHCR